MGDFWIYMLKVSGCLTVFYLFYHLLLARDTFHLFNRMALLSIVLISIFLPFIRLVMEEPMVIQQTLMDVETFLQTADRTNVNLMERRFGSVGLGVLFMIYVGGCLFSLGKFLCGLNQVYTLIHKGKVTVLEDDICLVVTEQRIAPFSWAKYIVISRKDLEESGMEILTHERAHIQALHSWDICFVSLCTILHWFNPTIWLLKQDLQNIHEYEADEYVITHGVDAKHYQLLLIKKAVGTQRFTSMANSFNHSKLKKRITMMLKKKSNPWGRLKYLYVLPLAALAVTAFARPEITRKLEKISEVEEQNPTVSEQNVFKIQVKSDTTNSKTYSVKPEPLILVDGVERASTSDINPNQIESITVLKDKEALKQYGEKGKNGVLLITTKKKK